MTAIAGLWRYDSRPDAAEGCGRMLTAQELYGRDGGAQWADGSIAVGRNLSRLLPEDAYDRQPLVGGGRFVLVADVRLDNREELAAALDIPSERARVLCDAEIMLAAFECWGDDFCGRLVGDYAFALWDGIEHRLLAGRSPLGQRSLHYYRGEKFFAFASMAKGLQALPEVPYAPDEERIAEFLVLMPEAGSRTFFKDIERVEPGHVVTVARNRFSSRCHWQPQRRPVAFGSADDYAEGLRHHFDEAVRCRLRGIGDVGAHLSAGLDSSSVAATAARLLRPSGRKVIGFTAVPAKGYREADDSRSIGDEGPLAAMTAAMHPNIEHVLVPGDGRSPLDHLDRIFRLWERPALNTCNVGWGFGINDVARARGLTVMLDGAWGNATISYDGMQLIPELFFGGRWLRWWREASALVANGGYNWRGVIGLTFGDWLPGGLMIWLARRKNKYRTHLPTYSAINPERFVELNLRERARKRGLDYFYRTRRDSFEMRLWAMRRFDRGNYLKAVLGGWGIDMREPCSDRRLIEFCLAVPTEQFLVNGVKRALARRAFADRLPRQVLDEHRRGTQAADWHATLTAARGLLGLEIERIDACAPAVRALDTARMRRLVENWPAAGSNSEKMRAEYRLALLRGISAGDFLRRATGSNR